MKPEDFCNAMSTWAQFMCEADPDLRESIVDVELAVEKSCLLDRMIYGGEHPSKTPCPVHKGEWSGCHGMWPGHYLWNPKTGEKTPVTPDKMLQDWYDEGCRCFKHSCGCTTGWQPDEHCGCGKPSE